MISTSTTPLPATAGSESLVPNSVPSGSSSSGGDQGTLSFASHLDRQMTPSPTLPSGSPSPVGTQTTPGTAPDTSSIAQTAAEPNALQTDPALAGNSTATLPPNSSPNNANGANSLQQSGNGTTNSSTVTDGSASASANLSTTGATPGKGVPSVAASGASAGTVDAATLTAALAATLNIAQGVAPQPVQSNNSTSPSVTSTRLTAPPTSTFDITNTSLAENSTAATATATNLSLSSLSQGATLPQSGAAGSVVAIVAKGADPTTNATAASTIGISGASSPSSTKNTSVVATASAASPQGGQTSAPPVASSALNEPSNVPSNIASDIPSDTLTNTLTTISGNSMDSRLATRTATPGVDNASPATLLTTPASIASAVANPALPVAPVAATALSGGAASPTPLPGGMAGVITVLPAAYASTAPAGATNTVATPNPATTTSPAAAIGTAIGTADGGSNGIAIGVANSVATPGSNLSSSTTLVSAPMPVPQSAPISILSDATTSGTSSPVSVSTVGTLPTVAVAATTSQAIVPATIANGGSETTAAAGEASAAVAGGSASSPSVATPAQLLSGIERLFTLGSGREAIAGGVPASNGSDLNESVTSSVMGRSTGFKRSFDLGRAVVTSSGEPNGRLSTNARGIVGGTNAASGALPQSIAPSAKNAVALSTDGTLTDSLPSLAAGQESYLPDIGTGTGTVVPNGMPVPETASGALLTIPALKLMTETASREVEGVEEGSPSTAHTTGAQGTGGTIFGPQTTGTGALMGGNSASAQSGGNSTGGGNSGNSLGTSAGAATSGISGSSQIDRAQVISQVTQHLETMRLSNGSGEMRVQLNPEHLGNVQVSVSTHPEGVVARIAVDSTQIQQVMDGAKEHLRSTLEARGMRVSSVEVTVTQNAVGSDSGSNAAFAGQRQWQASTDGSEFIPASMRRNASVTGVDSAGVAAVAATATRTPIGSGGATRLDYRA